MAKKKLETWTMWFVLMGAIVWGFVGLGFNIVSAIFGSFAKWVYIVVGLSGLYHAWKLIK